jgi:hypothetical protein
MKPRKFKPSVECAARRARVIRDTAAGAGFDIRMGDPSPERSALPEFLRRQKEQPPRVSVEIAPRLDFRLREKRRARKGEEA